MIDTPTLFILGAGASKPYEYPTGAELRAEIVKSFDSNFSRLLDVRPPNVSFDAKEAQRQIPRFVEHFRRSSIESIDKYLALNPIDAYIGKIAITLSILKSEKKSCFREDIKNNNEDWYKLLFNRMTSTFNKPDDFKHFCKNKVAFITFNYDRSLEFFLYDSFYHSFNNKKHYIEKNVDAFVPFPIIHVYGSVAQISLNDWFQNACNYYSDFNSFKAVEKMSQGIRVIGEERSDDEIKAKVKIILKDHKRIFFLGFSYAKENLDAIGILENIDTTWDIFGTAKGMTHKEIDSVKSYFPFHERNIIGPVERASYEFTESPCIKDVNSYDLLREYL